MVSCFDIDFATAGEAHPQPPEVQEPDTTPPTIVHIDPSEGLENIPLNKAVKITFSEEMDTTTINTSTFSLKKIGEPWEPVHIQFETNFSTTRIVPLHDLSPNSNYRLFISGDVSDLAGNKMVEEFTSTFTTIDE